MLKEKCLIFSLFFLLTSTNSAFAQYAPKQIDGVRVNKGDRYLVSIFRDIEMFSNYYRNSRDACINYVRYGAPDVKNLDDLVFKTVPRVKSDLSKCYKTRTGSNISSSSGAGYSSFADVQAEFVMDFVSKSIENVPKNRNQLEMCPSVKNSIEILIQDLKRTTGYPSHEWCSMVP